MKIKKTLAIFVLISLLFSAVYVTIDSLAVAQEDELIEEENGDENDDLIIAPEDDEEEVENAEKLFDQLTKRLEKAELKLTKAPASMVITSRGKVTMVNVNLEAIDFVTGGDNEVLTVGLHGLTFQVDASGAKVYAGGKKIAVSDLEVGDKLLIKGVVDPDTGIIEATRIYDRSVHRQSIQNLRLRIQELLERIEELRARIRNL